MLSIFGEYALSFREAGANVVGGCCGTTPQHVAAMKKAFETTPAIHIDLGATLSVDEITAEPAEQPTQLAQKLALGKFAISVEMDPPRGLSTHKLIAGASLLVDAGADVINVADSPMARMRMSAWRCVTWCKGRLGLSLRFTSQHADVTSCVCKEICSPHTRLAFEMSCRDG